VTNTEQGGPLFSFTLDANTGEVVRVETLDAAGSRRKVPDRQRETLARKGRERLQAALEEAFEAGIDCVLGGDEPPDTAESERDAAFRHVLVAPLMKRSPASRLLKRDVLDRAILGTLMQHSVNSTSTIHAPHTP
jgi:hypothetical protein